MGVSTPSHGTKQEPPRGGAGTTNLVLKTNSMSIKFAIKSTVDKAKKEGEAFVRFSGTGEPFSRSAERDAKQIETDIYGNPTRWKFVTGLEEDQVDFYHWLKEEEKAIVKETIKELKPKIERAFGGPKMISDENHSFWKRRQDVSKLKLTPETSENFYDTENPEHALLYLSILANAFDNVAPNREYADRFQVTHYLALDLGTYEGGEDDDTNRADALAELTLLKREFGKDALYILAWCLQYDTSAFGAYSLSVTEKELMTYHMKYIEGKLKSKVQGRNFPKNFIEYTEKWRGAQTRQQLYVEAYIKAGEWFNYIFQKEKKYHTEAGTVLGNTIQEAVTALMKAKNRDELEKLRTQVETKWKE